MKRHFMFENHSIVMVLNCNDQGHLLTDDPSNMEAIQRGLYEQFNIAKVTRVGNVHYLASTPNHERHTFEMMIRSIAQPPKRVRNVLKTVQIIETIERPYDLIVLLNEMGAVNDFTIKRYEDWPNLLESGFQLETLNDQAKRVINSKYVGIFIDGEESEMNAAVKELGVETLNNFMYEVFDGHLHESMTNL